MHRSVVMWGIVLMAGIGAAQTAAPMPAHAATLGTANTVALKSGLVGHWTLDGDRTNWASNTTRDSSGSNSTGTLMSMSTSTSAITGKIGGALQFNGTSQYVNISANVGAFGGSYTVSGWFKANTLSDGGQIFSQGSGGNNAFELYTMPGFFLRSDLYDQNAIPVTLNSPNNSVNPNRWYHVVITHNNTTLRNVMYLNGVQQDANTSFAANTADSLTWNIGRKFNGSVTSYFPGTLDDIRVYNRALSATEVALLSALGSAKTGTASIASNGWSLGLSAGLVGHWTLDGDRTNWASNTTRDSSGSNNTGTLQSFSTTSSATNGKIGGALKFNGSSDYISTANSFSNPVPVTVATWFRTVSASGHKIVGFEDNQTGASGSTDRNLYMGTDGKIYFGWWNLGSITTITSLATMTDGKWHHAVGMHDGTNARLYIDGVLQGTGTGVLANFTGYWRIGGYSLAWPASGTGYFDGALDDVRIYHRMLSAQEVSQLYKLGQVTVGQAGLDANGKSLTLSSGLVGHWTLDGDRTNWASNTTRDSSGSGNTGTLVSMSTSTSPTLGKIGGALKFDGSTQYIDVGNPGSLQITSRITMAGWFRAAFVAPPTNAHYGIVAKGYDGSSTGYQLNFQNDNSTGNVPQLVCASWNGVFHGVGYTYGTRFANGAWNHAACVHDGSAWRLYVNGVEVAMSIDAVGAVSTPKNVLIGGFDVNGVIDWFPGSLDDVRVYNRALSAQEIQQLYRMGGSR